jgi:4-amino-4-deoxy-L-arabinose transferase-like glycosyltransferase
VEQSVWTAGALGYALIFLWIKKDIETKEYLTLMTLISIATLMRQSAFIAFLPIFISLGYDIWKKNISLRDAFFVSTPVLLCAPFLFHSFLFGTSATYIPGEDPSIASDASAFTRVWYALQSGFVWTAIKNSVEWVWTFFAIIPFVFSLKNFRRCAILFTLLFSALFIFYSIRPGLWGIGRYQAEYIIPFSVLGLFVFSKIFQKNNHFSRIFLPIIFCALILVNVFQFSRIPESNAPVEELVRTFPEKIKEQGEYRVLSEFPYEYGKALRVARDEGYAGSVYIAGSTYGIFPNILAGATVSEIRALRNSMGGSELRSDSNSLRPEAIHENMRIQLVLISDAQNKEFLVSELKKLGWREWRNFENTRYQSRIVGITRN